METINVKFKNQMVYPIAYAAIEDSKIYISYILDGTFPGYLEAIKAHEKVYFKGNGHFLNDNIFGMCVDPCGWIFYPTDLSKIVRDFLKKYKLKDLEQRLNNAKTSDEEYNLASTIEKQLSEFHRQCVNLIAYYETNDEETKNWIMLLPYINDEVHDFIQKKT